MVGQSHNQPRELMTYTKECTLHIKLHRVVVEMHDSDQALESSDLNVRGCRLCSFANDLHDVVTLALRRWAPA